MKIDRCMLYVFRCAYITHRTRSMTHNY
ncbi:MAG: hypothetical protein WBL02_05715 [Methanomethylovorans sp.]|nr:hypothetical protein [Methanomethylovorans sp.]